MLKDRCDLTKDLDTLANSIREKYFRIVNLDSNYLCFLITSVEFTPNLDVKFNYQVVGSTYIELTLDMLNSEQLENYSKYLEKIESFLSSGLLDIESDERSEAQFKRWLKLNRIVDYPQLVDTAGNLI
jgi:hypothetical protein